MEYLLVHFPPESISPAFFHYLDGFLSMRYGNTLRHNLNFSLLKMLFLLLLYFQYNPSGIFAKFKFYQIKLVLMSHYYIVYNIGKPTLNIKKPP